ncbi:ABC transporter ATP-binding protein [Actinospongicola halichondriae]|uniref:ABC transporter ATP-binding protein n=1 Tax=Actinospongicola halichondriae TaxID=3236844 RepID=UPI003D43A2DD
MAGSGTAHLRDSDDIVLRVENLTVEFPAGRGRTVHAVTDVSFDVAKGETLGIVGESGCGKSTTGKAIMRLVPIAGGSVTFKGTDITHLRGSTLRKLRQDLQMIFQDPVSSINPRRAIGDVVSEPLEIWDKTEGGSELVDRVLSDVGLDPEIARPKRRHEFSGGQCQRICIARALVLDPEVIICDEPVSALDVSVQAQILNLLEDMKERYGLTLMFIAHDLAVVKNVSDRVAVMYLGKICEVAAPDDLYYRPAHPYTAALLSAIPLPDPDVVPDTGDLAGDLPSPLDPPSGCRFRTRCSRATDRCAAEEPIVREVGPNHYVACHFPLVGETAPPTGATPVANPVSLDGSA